MTKDLSEKQKKTFRRKFLRFINYQIYKGKVKSDVIFSTGGDTYNKEVLIINCKEINEYDIQITKIVGKLNFKISDDIIIKEKCQRTIFSEITQKEYYKKKGTLTEDRCQRLFNKLKGDDNSIKFLKNE